MRRRSSGSPNEPGVSGVTSTLASSSGVSMPRLAIACRKPASWKTKPKSMISWNVRPSWPSVRGISTGGVKEPLVRFTVLLKLFLFWRKKTVARRAREPPA